jgi:hypothetical protein
MPNDRMNLLPNDHHIEHGAWLKPVTQPTAALRPPGLPPKQVSLRAANVSRNEK